MRQKTPTNPPNERQGLAQYEQKSQIQAKYGYFWAKKPIFTGEIKSFHTQITENPPTHLDPIVPGQNGQKMPIFGPK